MTTAEIRGLREKLLRFSSNVEGQQTALVALKGWELALLEHTLRSLIIWREWLVPND